MDVQNIHKIKLHRSYLRPTPAQCNKLRLISQSPVLIGNKQRNVLVVVLNPPPYRSNSPERIFDHAILTLKSTHTIDSRHKKYSRNSSQRESSMTFLNEIQRQNYYDGLAKQCVSFSINNTSPTHMQDQKYIDENYLHKKLPTALHLRKFTNLFKPLNNKGLLYNRMVPASPQRKSENLNDTKREIHLGNLLNNYNILPSSHTPTQRHSRTQKASGNVSPKILKGFDEFHRRNQSLMISHKDYTPKKLNIRKNAMSKLKNQQDLEIGLNMFRNEKIKESLYQKVSSLSKKY